MKRSHPMPFGAAIAATGTRFRLWAPAARAVDVGIETASAVQWHPMIAQSDGWYGALVDGVAGGARYRFRIDGDAIVADPASRFNPNDVHGASEVVDPNGFEWPDGDWRGRPWDDAVLYELHVGTFTRDGTFAAASQRLDYLVELGVTVIELMPLADFPGRRNWGYDGVLMFAPDSSYGSPDDLKAFVVAAHQRGLMVLVDVVYNHFGPEGNYLHRYAPQFFTDRHHTPWGAAINFDGAQSRVVREFYIHNALYWLIEFNVDGLRFDAVHAIVDDSTPDILSEIAARVRAGPGCDRHIHLVLENDRNEARRLTRDARGKPRAFTAQWNDDLHHALHAIVTGERDGYYVDYAERPNAALGRCLAEGFAYQGEPSPYRGGRARGEPSDDLSPGAFVSFLQNHDQVGNRAFGERLSALVDAQRLRAAVAIVLLAPSPPLLFMGEEFGAATPFLFFCDFEPQLAHAVSTGRREEFASFVASLDDDASIPDPSDVATFDRSKLDWRSITRSPHAEWLAYYRRLLALRRAAIVPLVAMIDPSRREWRALGDRGIDVRWPLSDASSLALIANMSDDRIDRPDALRDGSETLFATPGALDDARTLAPWSVIWRRT